jgi:hypothetical protein
MDAPERLIPALVWESHVPRRRNQRACTPPTRSPRDRTARRPHPAHAPAGAPWGLHMSNRRKELHPRCRWQRVHASSTHCCPQSTTPPGSATHTRAALRRRLLRPSAYPDANIRHLACAMRTTLVLSPAAPASISSSSAESAGSPLPVVARHSARPTSGEAPAQGRLATPHWDRTICTNATWKGRHRTGTLERHSNAGHSCVVLADHTRRLHTRPLGPGRKSVPAVERHPRAGAVAVEPSSSVLTRVRDEHRRRAWRLGPGCGQ